MELLAASSLGPNGSDSHTVEVLCTVTRIRRERWIALAKRAAVHNLRIRH